MKADAQLAVSDQLETGVTNSGPAGLESSGLTPSPAANQYSARRYLPFDSLRSIAALIVLLAHSQELFGAFILKMPWPVSGLLDSKAAVAFFFVLSGFVLHLSFSKTPLSFGSFVGFQVRRIFRIYPLYWLSLLAVVAAIYLQDKSGFSQSVPVVRDVVGANHADVNQWLQQLLLVGPGFDMYFLNPPAWTLAVEMRVAVIFPFLSWVLSGLRLRNAILLVCVSFPTAMIGAKLSRLGFIELVPLFLMGAVFAHHRSTILKTNLSGWQLLLFTVLSIVLYSLRKTMHGYPAVGWYLTGLGSVGFLVLALRSTAANKFLQRAPLVFIGEMSYGIYILHFAIFLALSAQLSKLHSSWTAVFFVLGVLLTIGISWLCYRFVEKPLIEVGRKVSAR